ncbi:hypothetical protein C8Q74DRAFT_1031334 [Fomes fomentarius]|nr:hypothetical protein C8Q74DRAFT_1031334 [Fomes fomentarius]
MARTYTIISGSFALQFLDRTYYPGSDLDLYVHPDDSILEICLWLEQEGYVYVPASRQNPMLRVEIAHIRTSPHTDVEHADVLTQYDTSSVRGILYFERSSPQDPCDIRKVQVMVSHNSPMEAILCFHSTCVMNIVTYNAVYSLYPYATFEERTSLVVLKVSERTQLALDKYASRGFRILDNLPSPTTGGPLLLDAHATGYFSGVARWVSDAKSWIVPLNMDGVVLPSAPSGAEALSRDPIAECGWHLMAQMTAGDTISTSMNAINIQSPRLGWRYTGPWNTDYSYRLERSLLYGELALCLGENLSLYGEEWEDVRAHIKELRTSGQTKRWDAILPKYRQAWQAAQCRFRHELAASVEGDHPEA